MRQLRLQVGIFVLSVVSLIGLSILIAQPASTSVPARQIGVANSPADSLDDGYDELPLGLQGLSMSSLVMLGLVHPPQAKAGSVEGLPPYQNPPLSAINWQDPVNISDYRGNMGNSNEPAAAMHPTNPFLALSGGNYIDPISTNNYVRIENSTDGGATWMRRIAPVSCSPSADGVPVWLAGGINRGSTALYSSLCRENDILHMKLSKSINEGIDWFAVNDTNINVDNCTPPGSGYGCNNDREYLWTDHNPTSPYYGRTYLTELLGSTDGDDDRPASYWTVGVRWTTDRGETWSPFVSLNDPGEYSSFANLNQFISLAIEPNGTIVAVWRRGKCCAPNARIQIDTENKVMWSRSTDGGVTFPTSGRIYTVPVQQSISWGSLSPGDANPPFAGFRWSDAPNVAADPVDGTLYAVWTAYRQPMQGTTAAVYLSRGTDDGTGLITWTAPVIVNNSYPNKYQFFPWVQVSKDHVVHVTYGAAIPSGTLNKQVAQFYVQSTDRGNTFTNPPFFLSGTFFEAFPFFFTDYNAMEIGGYDGQQGTIMTT